MSGDLEALFEQIRSLTAAFERRAAAKAKFADSIERTVSAVGALNAKLEESTARIERLTNPTH